MQTYLSGALVFVALSAPGMARDVRIGPGRHAITLARADLLSVTPAMAQRSLRRIDRAALVVCGAPEGSLREVTRAVRASGCWRDVVSDAVRRVDAPLLSQAWQDHP